MQLVRKGGASIVRKREKGEEGKERKLNGGMKGKEKTRKKKK